jgi:hypothetical protein
MQVQNDLDGSVTDEDLASANALQRSQKFSKVWNYMNQVLQTIRCVVYLWRTTDL